MQLARLCSHSWLASTQHGDTLDWYCSPPIHLHVGNASPTTPPIRIHVCGKPLWTRSVSSDLLCSHACSTLTHSTTLVVPPLTCVWLVRLPQAPREKIPRCTLQYCLRNNLYLTSLPSPQVPSSCAAAPLQRLVSRGTPLEFVSGYGLASRAPCMHHCLTRGQGGKGAAFRRRTSDAIFTRRCAPSRAGF